MNIHNSKQEAARVSRLAVSLTKPTILYPSVQGLFNRQIHSLNLEATATINCKQFGKENASVVIFSFTKERRYLFIDIVTKKVGFLVLK